MLYLKSNKKGGTATILLIVAALILLGTVAFPVLLLGAYNGGKIDKATNSAGPGGTVCYIEDSGFFDLSISADIDLIIEKLRTDNIRASQIDRLQTETPDAKEFKYYIEQIVSKGLELKINPSIAIAIWWGEQEFLHPEKAFGYKFFDSGTAQEVLEGSTEERWQKQLNGVYELIKQAIDNTGGYTNPPGENTITRLFYNYATAMQNQYNDGQVGLWSQSYDHPEFGNPYYKRLNIIQLLNPDLVTCIHLGGVGIASGNFTCPVDVSVAKKGTSWGDVVRDRNYRTGTYVGHEGLDIMTAVGSNVYSASNGKVSSVSQDNDGDGESSTSITIEENSSTFWYYTHLQNTEVTVGATVTKGEKIAEVGQFIRASGPNKGEEVNHLHLGISKRASDRATAGTAYNWEAWYYPYEFLRHIDCLDPPPANEVSYP